MLVFRGMGEQLASYQDRRVDGKIVGTLLANETDITYTLSEDLLEDVDISTITWLPTNLGVYYLDNDVQIPVEGPVVGTGNGKDITISEISPEDFDRVIVLYADFNALVYGPTTHKYYPADRCSWVYEEHGPLDTPGGIIHSAVFHGSSGIEPIVNPEYGIFDGDFFRPHIQ